MDDKSRMKKNAKDKTPGGNSERKQKNTRGNMTSDKKANPNVPDITM